MLRSPHSRKSGVAVMSHSSEGVSGHVLLSEWGEERTRFVCRLSGLRPGLHGFHVHQSGDLRKGCESACSHHNPTGSTHGGPTGERRHKGDLGNVRAGPDGSCRSIVVADVSLDEIVGRMIVVHADADDLGLLHGDEESKRTGNAGKRVACGAIGRV